MLSSTKLCNFVLGIDPKSDPRRAECSNPGCRSCPQEKDYEKLEISKQNFFNFFVFGVRRTFFVLIVQYLGVTAGIEPATTNLTPIPQKTYAASIIL
jgi:hypothetical protein